MTIYIDVLFLENLILNFIILYTVYVISKVKRKFIKIVTGATIGALYSVMYYYIRISVYSNMIVKISLSIIMVYISYTPKNIKELIKLVLLFYLVSFVFGGATLAIIYIMDANKITIQNGILIGNYTIRAVFEGIIIASIIIIFAFKMMKAKFSKKDLLCNLEIFINEKRAKIRALVDTGNLLKEPISNTPVIVVEKDILNNIVSDEILNNTEKILDGDLKEIPEGIKTEYMSKFKVIPFRSLGKENGMLLGLKADKVKIEENNTEKIVNKVIIGLYNKKLSKKNEYNALIGIDII